jgi:alpha-1,6-mannosyltransferase
VTRLNREPLRVADVSVLYGTRSGGIRTYLRAKADWARRTGSIDHHVVLPGQPRRSAGYRHELRSVPWLASNGYRLPLGGASMRATLEAIDPDVVLLHDPFWTPRATAQEAHAAGRPVIAVHHTSVALNAAALPGPGQLWERPLRRWYRHAYRDVDAVMSVVDTTPDSGRPADVPLRLGLDPAFRPRPEIARAEHVLFVGRISREKGLAELLEAVARSEWSLLVHGAGPWEETLRDRAKALGIRARVRFGPYLESQEAVARAYAAAGCVVAPGAHETFGLVALEAAASGARVVVADSAPSCRLLGPLGHRFRAGDASDLRHAIREALATPRDLDAAAALADRHSWERAFAAELAELRRLLGVSPARSATPAAVAA